MQILSSGKTYNFLKHGNIFFGISILLILGSIALFIIKGLPLGIDFAGGSVIQVKYEKTADLDRIRQSLASNQLFEKAVVTEFGSSDEVLIKVPVSMGSVAKDIGDVAAAALEGSGDFTIRRVDMVGPKVGDQLKEKGIMALTLASLAIMIYVSIRYEWRFALAAVLALFHDIILAVGAIIIFRIDVNLDVIAALLTILGYSINDTIVVFDRIRESINTSKRSTFNEIVNEAVSNTLSRTLLTSLTVFFVVLTLYLFGGEIMKGFSFPLLIGVAVGTYSSIFIAAQSAKYFGFSVAGYRKREAERLKRKMEKEKIRAMYEQGVV